MEQQQSYEAVFDQSNHNWRQDPIYNHLFLKGVQQYMNNMLQVRGHVFLNEVFDSLGMPRTSFGQIIGWFWEEGSNIVDFLPTEIQEGSVRLTFNPDGEVYTKL
jgi:hypothetical protein